MEGRKQDRRRLWGGGGVVEGSGHAGRQEWMKERMIEGMEGGRMVTFGQDISNPLSVFSPFTTLSSTYILPLFFYIPTSKKKKKNE